MSSASQWKRCFTNPDSWMKWNIFSALFLGLELADLSIPTSRDTPHHICLSHTWGTRKTRIFLHKRCGFLGVARVRLLCFPARVRGFSKDSSTRISSSCSLAHGNSPCLWFFWRQSKKSFIQIQPGRLRHQERSLKRQSGSHSSPCALAPPGLGRWGNSTPSFFPVQKFWE